MFLVQLTLFVVDEPLGDKPDDSTDEEENRLYRLRLELEPVMSAFFGVFLLCYFI